MESDTPDIPARLALTVIDVDPDYLLVRVAAADGEFAGATGVYALLGSLLGVSPDVRL